MAGGGVAGPFSPGARGAGAPEEEEEEDPGPDPAALPPGVGPEPLVRAPSAPPPPAPSCRRLPDLAPRPGRSRAMGGC